jgi:hypothetical protein
MSLLLAMPPAAASAAPNESGVEGREVEHLLQVQGQIQEKREERGGDRERRDLRAGEGVGGGRSFAQTLTLCAQLEAGAGQGLSSSRTTADRGFSDPQR